MATTRLKGAAAMTYAREHGLKVSYYNTPLVDAREGVDLDDPVLAEIIDADPETLIYLDVEAIEFPCCGGSDEDPPEHCQDCPDKAETVRKAIDERDEGRGCSQ